MASFLAFGRTLYDEPLRQIGTLDAVPDDAGTQARARFDDDLIELTLVPEDDVVWVFREESDE